MQNNELGQLMKQGMRRLASGVSVLSARLEDGNPFVMTVSSVTSVSDNPPSLLVCINRQIQRHEELLPLGSSFVINLLANDQRDVSDLCAGRYPDKDRLSQGQWQQEGDWLFLADSQVSFLCHTDKTLSYGTHEILVGKIAQVKLHRQEVNPLIYSNGAYASLQGSLKTV